MADTFTTNLNLTKPEVGASTDTWGTKINADLDAVDAIFAAGGTAVHVKFASANFDDNAKAIFGTGDDLQIFHDGTDSYVNSNGADLRLKADDVKIYNYAGTEVKAIFTTDGSVDLYHNNVKKFETSATGGTVTGTLVATSLDISGDIDVDGTTNLDVVDIDGAVDMATTLTLAGNADFNGDLDVDGTTNLDAVDIDGAVDMATTLAVAGTATFAGLVDAAIIDGVNFKVNGGQGSDGQVLTSTGSGVAWEAASGGATDINGLSDAKTFGTSSLMLGDATTGTIDGANYNTGLGVDVFAALTSGDSNSVFGTNAGSSITTGNYNVAIGRNALDACTTVDNNVAVGWTSLGQTTTGPSNTAVGGDSMAANTTGTLNVAVGTATLDANTSGERNTALGIQALGVNTTGGYNTAVGERALDANTTASNNSAVGSEALGACTEGHSNTAAGFQAGFAITTGDNNIMIGYQAGISGSPGGAISTANNTLSLGDENIATANIQVDWTVASDKRDKTDVESLNMGLDFINKLEPVTYRWDKRSKYSDDQSVTPDGTHKEEQLDVGFLAQDVEALEKEYGYDFDNKTNLTTQLSEDNQMYGLKYSKFVPMLVKSIQELTTQVEMLKTEVATLKGE